MRPDRSESRKAKRDPRRFTDRIEHVAACAFSAAALVVLLVSGVLGLAVHAQQTERVERENATRVQVEAVLLEDAVVVPGDRGGRIPVHVAARWNDPVGRQHTGEVVVRSATSAGQKIDIWVDRSGMITSAPSGAGDAVAAGLLTMTGMLLAGALVLGIGWHAVRQLVAACNARRWEREWASVEPVWSRELR